MDVHRPVPKNLADVLSWEVERVVQADWTVACDGRRYQLDRQHAALSLVRRRVIVRTLRTGQVQLVYRGQRLQWRLLPAEARRPLPAAPPAAPPAQPKKPRRTTPGPAATHPWRRFGIGVGRNFRRRGARAKQQQRPKPKLKKGTFSPELNRGHF